MNIICSTLYLAQTFEKYEFSLLLWEYNTVQMLAYSVFSELICDPSKSDVTLEGVKLDSRGVSLILKSNSEPY